MPSLRSIREPAVWASLALAGGFAVARVDLSASDVQGPVLLLMLLDFVLTLPGRASVILVAVASALGVPLLHAAMRGDIGLQYFLVFVPAVIAAGGGRAAGTLLDTAAARIAHDHDAPSEPWRVRPLTRRFLLAVALVGIAAMGVPIAWFALHGHRAAAWLAIVWQVLTLLGWIAAAPIVLAAHERIAHQRPERAHGPVPVEAAWHVATLAVLIAMHVAAIVCATAVLRIPLEPDAVGMAARAAAIYVPLDTLAHLAIVALSVASDAERQRRASREREQALRAEVVETRFAALRARLNPHFLFNTLNGIHALARGGRAVETSDAIERVTALLRYVLDGRRATVSLRDELGFVREYLELQRLRFGDRLRFSIDVDATLLSAAVPQLLLQPIVENAVEHGITNTLDGGSVRLAAQREGDILRLEVDDEGAEAQPPATGRGIGLASTRERLARTFGERGSIVLERKPSGGARVVIRLPYDATEHRASDSDSAGPRP